MQEKVGGMHQNACDMPDPLKALYFVVFNRNSMPMFPSGLLHLIKEYAQTPKQDNSENFSPEKAKRILSDIATQLRPSSVQQPAANTPFSILQNRKRGIIIIIFAFI